MSRTGHRKWRTVRAFVLRRDAYRCAWCGGIADTADHVVAYVDGGTDDPGNLVAACTPCNLGRGRRARPPHTTAAPPSRAW